jgi:hypothetical protein
MLRSRSIRGWRRIPPDLSTLHFINVDMIGFQSDPERLIQRNSRGAVGHRRRHRGRLRIDQIALLERDVVGRRGAQAEALRFGVKQLLL